MFEIIVGLIIIFIFWKLFFSNKKSVTSFKILDSANTWFIKEGIDSSKIIFSTYDEDRLVKNQGATVLIGIGKNKNSKEIAFILEIKEKIGVIESAYIEPVGIASHHKKAAMRARLKDKYLIDTLKEMAREHRMKQGY